MSTVKATRIRVFISYSHDSKLHKDRVLALATMLQQHGIECVIDQAEQASDRGWIRWMMSELASVDFVLLCCTETYERRFLVASESARGYGATWEGNLILNEFYEMSTRSNKFIPIVFEDDDKQYIPAPLRGRDYFDVSREDRFWALYRLLTEQPEVVLPSVGPIIQMPPRGIPQHVFIPNKAGEASAESSINLNDPSAARKLLFEAVKRLLMANHQVFMSYGPQSLLAQNRPMSVDGALMWDKRKREVIIPNNARIIELMNKGMSLLTNREYETFLHFREHAVAFQANAERRRDRDTVPQFPEEFEVMIMEGLAGDDVQ